MSSGHYSDPVNMDKGCAHPGCDKTFKSHKWGSMKAHREGWFLQNDGTAWCPDHNPEWVAAWRARQIDKD